MADRGSIKPKNMLACPTRAGLWTRGCSRPRTWGRRRTHANRPRRTTLGAKRATHI